jgi:DNA-binding MarR family transcriptional regulator
MVNSTISNERGRSTLLGVHPGWLTVNQQAEPEAATCDKGPRFEALYELLTAACALERAAIEILSDLNLTAGAFFALLEIEAAGERGLAPSELSKRIAVARRTATLYIDILAREGWVERSAHPDDKRMVLARLSTAGAELLGEQGAFYRERLGHLLDPLSPLQAERLHQLLGTLTGSEPTVEL